MRRRLLCLALGLTVALSGIAAADTGPDAFAQGSREYSAGHFDAAAASFGQAIALAPSTGARQNLGLAEWQLGHAGPAILAWERAEWLDPMNADVRGNLRFARRARLLEVPELSWYEICSTWLPVNAWPWIACLSFWVAAGMVWLPVSLRWRRAGWQQALAAAGFAVFLLTLPALAGVYTRTKLGVVLAPETPLRLTPTAEAQSIARLSAGEMARVQRQQGNYLYIRTASAAGWIDRAQFTLVIGEAAPVAK